MFKAAVKLNLNNEILFAMLMLFLEAIRFVFLNNILCSYLGVCIRTPKKNKL